MQQSAHLQGRILRSGLGFCLAAIILVCPLPVQAASHALLVGIADYLPPTPALPPVKKDMMHAREMALLLGVPAAHTRSLADSEAGRERVLSELDALADRVASNDHVFLYFSGHGQRTSDPDQAGQCLEHLVAYGTGRERLMNERMFRGKIKAIAERAGHVLVFLDACHSGGMKLSRSLNAGDVDEPWTAKALPQEDSCREIRNRSLSRSLHSDRNNITVLAAAQPDEVARVTKDREGGSYATLAWLSCLRNGKAADLNNSGGISAGELLICSQREVDRLAVKEQKKTQHLVLEGDETALMSFIVPPPSAVIVPPLAAAAPLRPSLPLAPPPPAAASPAAALRELYATRDPNWPVTLGSDRPRYRIGQEMVRLRATSARPGFLYILQFTEDEKTVCLLFPNSLDQNNRIETVGGSIAIDENRGWGIMPRGSLAGGDARDSFTALVVNRALDLSKMALMTEGAFQCSAAAAWPESLAALMRAFLEDDAGRDSFGAARLEVEEYR